jgi:hypothetical protein
MGSAPAGPVLVDEDADCGGYFRKTVEEVSRDQNGRCVLVRDLQGACVCFLKFFATLLEHIDILCTEPESQCRGRSGSLEHERAAQAVAFTDSHPLGTGNDSHDGGNNLRLWKPRKRAATLHNRRGICGSFNGRADNLSNDRTGPAGRIAWRETSGPRLMARIRRRCASLRRSEVSPDEYLCTRHSEISGSFTLYCAGRTDQIYTREETLLLQVAECFDGGIYGTLKDYKSFSKEILIKTSGYEIEI